ncbi:hypothetical protein M9458_024485, partial [Cirrhinus mrigala]
HRNQLEWANAHIRWRLALWRGVLFMDESRFSLMYGVMWVSGLLPSTFWIEWPMVAVGVMVWAGECHGQRTQVHFIDGILNAQRYHDEILRPIVVPFIHDHHLMLKDLICTQFLEAENILALAWPAYSPDMSPMEHVWDALDRRIRRGVPVPANNFTQPLKRSGPTFHRPQSTTRLTLCEGDVLHCVMQMVVTPDTD